jgi:polysaccharide biosynthesis protein PslG
MTVRDTIVGSPQPQQHPARHRQRVRGFAMAWTGITLLIGALTFVAIYAATGIAASTNLSNRGIPPAGISESVSTQAATPVAEQIAALPLETASLVPSVAAPATNTQPSAGDTGNAVATPAPTQAQAAGPVPTVSPIQDMDFDLGIAVQENADPNTFKIWTEMVGKQLKLSWIKMQVEWSHKEQVKGQMDFGSLDIELPMLREANIKVMLSIAKAPEWARDPGAKTKPDPNGDLHDGPPKDPQDFANFITALLKRYPKGTIHAIEVWNEINLDREWTTQPQQLDPKRYVELLRVAHAAIKAFDPNIIVISAALSPTGAKALPRAMDDFVFLDQLIKAGMLQYTDCLGAHHNGINVPPDVDYSTGRLPERKPPAKYRGPWDNPNHSWSFKATLLGYADIIKKNNSNIKMCLTEFGWPSTQGMIGSVRGGFGFAADNTLADQADFTDKALTLMQEWGFVRIAWLWNLNYAAQAGFDLQGPVGDNVAWSILGKDYQPRPVWQKIVDRNFRDKPRKATP